MTKNTQHRLPVSLVDLEKDVCQRYPDLRLINMNGKQVFRGSYPIILDGNVIDRFSIEISFPEGVTKPPLIREIGGRIPKTLDRHVYSSGYICTEVPELTLLRGYSLISYLEGPVRNYFNGQSLVERGQPWPFGEWAHRKEGLLQAYGEVLGVSEEPEIRRYLDRLGHKKVKGHWPCPCASGRQIRQCHVKVIRKLQETVPPRIARQALERLNRHS